MFSRYRHRSFAAPSPTPASARLHALLLGLALLVSGCASTGLPDGIAPVRDFELARYRGTWYEIARLDHRFERGLSNVSAEYSTRPDGALRVANRGWSDADGEWSEALGRARPVGADDVGHLAVSFFGPFYGSYVIFELDEGYQQAWVTGADRDTLWLLARTPSVPAADLARFRARTQALGFDLSSLIVVDQQRNAAR